MNVKKFKCSVQENINGLLDYCIEAKVKGIICFDIRVTLRNGDREYFYAALDRHFAGLKEKYMQLYGNSYIINSKNNSQLMALIRKRCKENSIMCDIDEVFSYLHTYETREEQLSLFNT